MPIRETKEDIGWPAVTRPVEVRQVRYKKPDKPVGYPGQHLLDGEFDSPPSPPECKSDFIEKMGSFLCNIVLKKYPTLVITGTPVKHSWII